MRNGPLKGVARSMPTSGAVDRVAKKNKYFYIYISGGKINKSK